MAVGKCDVCNEFHVWCWDCGQKFTLKDEDEHACVCDGRFWLTAVEDEEEDAGRFVKSIFLLLILAPGIMIPVDRRKLQ